MSKSTNCRPYFLYVCFVLVQIITTSHAQTKSINPSYIIRSNAAVEINPNNPKAITIFLNAAKNDSIIEKHYKIWIKRFPKSYTIPFTFGKWYGQRKDPKAKYFLLKTIAINPELAEAWFILSSDATLNGDRLASRNYLETAIKIDVSNAKYAFAYAYSFRSTNNSQYQQLTLEAIRRFPEDEKGAQALYWLANDAISSKEKVIYYEQLYKRYINKTSPWLESGMNDYFVLLLDSNPDEALELAVNMFLGLKQNWGYWPRKIEVAKKFRDARIMLTEKKPAKVLEILNSVNLGNYISADFISAEKVLLFFKAKAADQAGHTQAAYDSLTFAYSKRPEDSFGKVMLSFGIKLGKDSTQVSKDVWQMRDSLSEKATVFNLKGYLKEDNVSLADFKGKVVLLTYWFPACGPCIREFPHIESVIKKYNTEDIAYLAVNIIRKQDDYVLPFLEKTGYSFLPLKDEPFKDKGTLGIQGVPTNFLIDQESNIVFKNFIISKDNEKMLELMINEVVNRKRIQS